MARYRECVGTVPAEYELICVAFTSEANSAILTLPAAAHDGKIGSGSGIAAHESKGILE